MTQENRSPGRPRRTFTEEARRRQITEAAIETVNELGYHGTSLAQVAVRAKTSKSVISYHFDGREDLLLQVVTDIFGRFDTDLAQGVEQATGAVERLTAYVRTYTAHLREHHAAVLAAMEIAVSHRGADGVPMYLAESVPGTGLVSGIIAEGIAEGVFRKVDRVVAATMVTHALDGAMTRVQADPATDLAAYGEHLADLLVAALEHRTRG